jgi:hypothetical protein
LAAPVSGKEKKIVESKWTAAPVQIDGVQADWAQDTLETEKSVAASYAFKNDANFLYLLFVFNDPKFVSSIEATGMTLWLNAEGKEKKLHGLRFYRKMLNPDQFIQHLEKEGQLLTDEKKQEIKAKPGYILFACDTVNKKGEVVPHPGAGSGTYRMARVQKSMAYEFVIPMALLADPASKIQWDASKPLKVGFEWGGMTEEMKKARAAQIGAQGAQAGAEGATWDEYMGGEGGEGFSAPSASLAAMRRAPKKYDFWIDLKIAQNL